MTATRIPLRSPCWLAVLLGGCMLLTTGCTADDGVLAPGQPHFAAGSGGDVMFNPQPDPPKEILRFLIDAPDLVATPDARWIGTFARAGRGGGGLTVEQLLPAVQRGETLHLRQRWSFDGDGVALPAVQVDGVLNLRSGRLVLRGFDGDGKPVHIQGSSTGGSIGGEVMFNPQPDPPMPQP